MHPKILYGLQGMFYSLGLTFSVVAGKIVADSLRQFDRILSFCEKLIAKEKSTSQTAADICHKDGRHGVILSKINPSIWST